MGVPKMRNSTVEPGKLRSGIFFQIENVSRHGFFFKNRKLILVENFLLYTMVYFIFKKSTFDEFTIQNYLN